MTLLQMIAKKLGKCRTPILEQRDQFFTFNKRPKPAFNPDAIPTPATASGAVHADAKKDIGLLIKSSDVETR